MSLHDNAIPSAPFVTKTESWTMLAMKRMIRYAAENGFDRIAWTTGEQQADRYDLSKHIKAITWYKENDTGYTHLDIRTKDGDRMLKVDNLLPESVAEHVGKELAQKIADSPEQRGSFTGLDLKVGGEGMKAFYDQMLPQWVNKYVKKWGGKVGNARITTETGRVLGEESFGVPGTYRPRQDVTVPSIDITPAMRESAMQGQPMFSINAGEGILGPIKIENHGKPMGELLNLFDRNQIVLMYEDRLPELRKYKNLRNQANADRNAMYEPADEFLKRLKTLDTKERDKLANIAHEATIEGVDPSSDKFRLTPTIKDLEKSVNGLEQRKSEGHKLTEKQERLLTEGKKRLASKKPTHTRLRSEFLSMSKNAQELFVELRDEYIRNAKTMFDALEERLDRMDLPEGDKASAIQDLRMEFDRLKQNIYFPLYRRGDWVVVAKKEVDGMTVPIVEYHEKHSQAEASANDLLSKGYEVKVDKKEKLSSQIASNRAMKRIVEVVKNASDKNMDGLSRESFNALLDEVNQTIIQSLPDQSFRRHFAHRKNVPGYSHDFIRAYSDHMFRSASHIANLRYGDQITKTISDMSKRVGKMDGDVSALRDVVNHVINIEEKLMVKNAKWSATLGKYGFLNMLGSASNLAVNLTQTPLLTFPHIGARYGFAKASFQLTRALNDQIRSIKLAKSLDDIGRAIDIRNRLSGDELDAVNRLHSAGKLDLTQAFDLINAANTETPEKDSKFDALMKIASLPMHVSEVVNRQVSAITTIRLELAKSGDIEKAVSAAADAIDETHYDYASDNRALIMQGNIQRVLFMFKQYAQKTAFLWGHTAKLAFAGKTAEQRKIARKQLAGMFVMQAAMGGVLGLPVFAEAAVIGGGVVGFKVAGKTGAYAGSLLSALALIVASAFGDDDGEDFETEVRNFLADMVGKDAGEAISRGLFRLIGVDIAGRIDASELLLRRPSPQAEDKDRYTAWLVSLLGPMIGGTMKNVVMGIDMMREGHIQRGLEYMIPVKQIRDAAQAYRFATEGVKNLAGNTIVKDITPWDVAIKAVGFNPAKVAEAYERNQAKIVFDREWGGQRTSLLKEMNEARAAKEPLEDYWKKIREFNKKAPNGYKITGDTVIRSYETFKRNQKEAVGGVRIPKKRLKEAEKVGRFAND